MIITKIINFLVYTHLLTIQSVTFLLFVLFWIFLKVITCSKIFILLWIFFLIFLNVLGKVEQSSLVIYFIRTKGEDYKIMNLLFVHVHEVIQTVIHKMSPTVILCQSEYIEEDNTHSNVKLSSKILKIHTITFQLNCTVLILRLKCILKTICERILLNLFCP
jgi:hypothetical protein